MAAKSKKSAGKAKKTAKAKRPAKAKKPAKPKKAVALKRVAKKPAKRPGLRGPKGRSGGGGGVILEDIVIEDDSNGTASLDSLGFTDSNHNLVWVNNPKVGHNLAPRNPDGTSPWTNLVTVSASVSGVGATAGHSPTQAYTGLTISLLAPPSQCQFLNQTWRPIGS